MKTQLKRFSKSTLAVVLTLCMLFSCMTVGIIATDAAKTTEERVGAIDGSEAVGANDALTANTTFYLQLDTTNGWGQDSPTIKIEWHYHYNNGSGDKHSDGGAMTSLGNGLYSATVPNNNYIRAVKVNRYSTDGNKYWGHYGWGVASERSSNDNNELTITGWSDGKSTAWSTYTPVASHTINYTQPTGGTVDTSGSLTSAREGAEVTLTNSPAYGYVFSSYTVTKQGDSSTTVTVSNGKFTMPEYDVDVTAAFAENTSMTFYATGRFETSTANTGSSWDTTSTNIPFTHSGEFDWIVDTGKTLKDYTGGYSLNTNKPVYLKVYDGNTVFGANYTFTDNDTSTALTGGSDYSVAFNSQNDNGTVVLHFDPRSKTLSYTLSGAKPRYTTPTITLANATGTEDSGNFTITVDNYAAITAEDSNVQFKLYKDGNEVNGVSAGGANGNVFTLARSISNNGVYTVKAIATAGSTRADSLASSPVTVNLISRANVYLLGLKNEYNWDINDSNKMTYNESTGLYEITRTIYGHATTYGSGSFTDGDTGFKVYEDSSSDNKYYGSSAKITATGQSEVLTNADNTNNVRLTTIETNSSTAVYTFTYNLSTHTVTVTYPSLAQKTVTFGVDSGTASNGGALTAAIGETALTSGQSYDYGSSVTFTAAPNTGYKAEWYSDAACTTAISNTGNTYTTTLTDNLTVYVKYVEKDAPITIYVCDNKPLVSNAANLCFYTFHGTTTGATGAWPGKTAASAQDGTYTVTNAGTIDNKTVYKLELDPDAFAADKGIIINGEGHQTSDLALADGQIYFTAGKGGSQDVFDQSMLDDAVQRYVIAGTKGLVGSDPWSTTSHIMKYNSNGTYTITFNNVAASPEYGTLAFKVIKYDSNWVAADYTNNADNVAIASNANQKKIDDSGNIAFTTTKKSNVTITYNPNVTNTNVVTISAADIPTTNLTTTFYVDKDKVNGLYVWTDSEAEPLGTWSQTDSNVSSIDTIERPTGYNSGSYVKLTFNSSDSTFKYIVKKGTDKSADSASYPIGGTYVIGSITNVPTVLGGGGGGSNSDKKWDAIFVEANKVPSNNRNKYLLKSNNSVPNSTNFTSTGLDAYVSDGKIYFKIPYATVSANKYFMLVGTDDDYTSDWYQITNNSGNSITNVFVDTSASEYLTAAKKECYGQDEGHTNTNYFYSQVNIQEGAENTFSNVVLEIDPAQSKRTFTYYTYGATPIAKMPKVVVENGSYGYQSKYGTATVSTPSGLTGTAGTWWTTYRVEEGTQLYITTTINSDCRGDGTDSGMYVAAYAVNGVKYDVEQSGNTYTFVNTKPITVGTEDIEITPVYYSRSIEKNNDYITIYVEADSELINHWGDQIYVYSYYYLASGQAELDGNYPGQTLALDASGYYVGKIAKYNYTGTGYPQTKDASHPVSGVTFSGGYENNAPHHNFIDYAQNRQTYDYDDFKYIANLGYDTVRLDLKYTPQTTDSNQHMLINNATNHPETIANNPATSGYDVSKVQGYEYLYDFDYNPCSVLGLSQKVARDFGGTWNDEDPCGTNHKVKIISVGNQNYSGTGEWSTYWYVYQNKGTSESPVWKLVTSGLPSDFICRADSEGNAYKFDDSTEGHQTAQWRAVYSAGLAFEAADIAYEAEMGASTSTSSKNTGHRIDARWLYTTSQSRYEVHAGVAVYDASTGNYYLDKNNFGAASPTGDAQASAYIDGSTNKNRNAEVSSKRFEERNVDAYLTTSSPSSAYYFAYWALVKGTQPTDSGLADGSTLSDVEKIPGGEDPTTKITASTNQFFVAVYKPITGGKLILKHDAYTDGSLTGTGNRYIKADIVQSNGTTVVSSFTKNKDQLTVTGITNQMADRGYLLKITLYTSSLDSSAFNKFWLPNNNAVVSSSPSYSQQASSNSKDGKVCTEADPATYTITVALSDVYSAVQASEAAGTDPDAYTIVYKSDLDTGYKYQIVYTYTSRYWEDQTYTVKGTFTTEEFNTYVIDSSGTLTFDNSKKDKFLAAHSPYEDNFKETVKWKFSDATNLTYDPGTKTFSTNVAAKNEADRTINIKFVFPFEYNDNSKTGTGVYHIGDKDNEGKLVGLVPTQSADDGNKILKIDPADNLDFTDKLTYLDWYSLNDCKNAADKADENKANEPFLLEAPNKIYTKDGSNYTEWTFQYWSLKTYPTDGSEAVEYKKCYSRFFNLALYQSTIATPVYKVVTDDNPQVKPAGGESATINFLENSRNQWNYGGGNKVENVKQTWKEHGDRLFSDFVLTFEYNGKTLKELDKNNYKTGIVIESVGDLTPDAYGEVTTKTPAEYKAQYEPNADATTTAKNNAVDAIKAANDLTLQNGESGKYLFAGVADIANLDDKNSIEFAYSFANISQSQGTSANPLPTTRKDKVYRAFSYVYDKPAGKVVISDAIYFTIYDMASITTGEAYTG